MPQPADMVYLLMQFDLSSSAGVVDHAEFGVYGSLSWSPASDADWDAAMTALAGAARSNWASGFPKPNFSPGVTLAAAKATRQNTSGHALNVGQDASSGGSWQGSGSQSLPWEVALCVSLYGYPRGNFVSNARSKRGRIYLPPLASAILINSLTGEISITDAENLRDAVGTWLSAVATTDLGASMHRWEPQILSKTHSLVSEIVQLSVDNKLDSQRRRQKQLPAVINSVNWP